MSEHGEGGWVHLAKTGLEGFLGEGGGSFGGGCGGGGVLLGSLLGVVNGHPRYVRNGVRPGDTSATSIRV